MSSYFYSLGMLVHDHEADGLIDYLLNLTIAILIANEENQ